MLDFTATLSSSSNVATEFWSNLGPLTTAFHAPAICQADPANIGLVEFKITSAGSVNNGSSIPPATLTSFDCGQANNFILQEPSCYPSAAAVHAFQTAPVAEWYGIYWSPGIVCPSGWSTAGEWTYTAQESHTRGIFEHMIGNHDMQATELMCCPNGFENIGGLCGSQVTTTTSGAMCYLNYQCSSASVCPSDPSPFSWDASSTATEVYISVYPISLVRQDSDLSLISSSSIRITRSTTHHTLPPPKSQSTTGATGNGDTGSSGSSSNIQTLVPAIVVPIVALFAIIAGVIWCLHARKRRARKRAEMSSIPPQDYENGSAYGSTNYSSEQHQSSPMYRGSTVGTFKSQ